MKVWIFDYEGQVDQVVIFSEDDADPDEIIQLANDYGSKDWSLVTSAHVENDDFIPLMRPYVG